MTDRWDIQELAWPEDIPAAVAGYADGHELAWLDSTADVARYPRGGRYSLICVRPAAVIEQFGGKPAELRTIDGPRQTDTDGWRLWRRALNAVPRLARLPGGLSPGWVGYVGFEMARYLERLPASHREDLGLPLLRLALYDRGVILDHRLRRATAVHAPQYSLGIPGVDDDWMDRWSAAATVRAVFPHVAARVVPARDRPGHEHAVARALEYIAAGDIYQVNLARRVRLDVEGDPLAAYAAVRRVNPAPYAALLRWNDGAVLSLSPELFLSLRGSRVRTRPIKGTRPRTKHRRRDAASRHELLDSDKEAAELTMIVDLHRNDLGRVCRYGSVRVEHARRLETHPTVFHTVADVVGRLAPGRDALDLLAACFPAGSISGVPKIRALEIIDELEPVARGVYTGAIGVLGLDGQMTFNVAIRTLQWRGSAATLYVGGGIVADSDPAAEYDETVAKAAGILRGLGVDDATPVADQYELGSVGVPPALTRSTTCGIGRA